MFFNPDFKERLVAALRSGKYKQTSNMLRSMHSGGMCCLGVACDVFDPNGWSYKTQEYIDGDVGCIYEYNAAASESKYIFVFQSSNEIPDTVLQHIAHGMIPSMNNKAFYLNDHQQEAASEYMRLYSIYPQNNCLSLAELNDSGMPFDNIADFIEQHC